MSDAQKTAICSFLGITHMSCVVRKHFAYAKTKTLISFAVTAKLISIFVLATRIVQSLFYLNPKFQACSHILWLYSPVCVRPGRKPRRPVFSQRGSYCRQDLQRLLTVEIEQVQSPHHALGHIKQQQCKHFTKTVKIVQGAHSVNKKKKYTL